jgi:hypothetical protein
LVKTFYIATKDSTFFCQGKVTEILPLGVEVLIVPHIVGLESLSQVNYDVDDRSWVIPLRFDSDRNGYDGNRRCTDTFWGEQDILCAGWDVYGFGQWHIDDVPFAERNGGPVNMSRHGMYLSTNKGSKKIEDDDVEEDDDAAAAAEVEEEEVAEETDDAAKDSEVKTNHPR